LVYDLHQDLDQERSLAPVFHIDWDVGVNRAHRESVFRVTNQTVVDCNDHHTRMVVAINGEVHPEIYDLYAKGSIQVAAHLELNDTSGKPLFQWRVPEATNITSAHAANDLTHSYATFQLWDNNYPGGNGVLGPWQILGLKIKEGDGDGEPVFMMVLEDYKHYWLDVQSSRRIESWDELAYLEEEDTRYSKMTVSELVWRCLPRLMEPGASKQVVV
jgi:hypothetical protein